MNRKYGCRSQLGLQQGLNDREDIGYLLARRTPLKGLSRMMVLSSVMSVVGCGIDDHKRCKEDGRVWGDCWTKLCEG